MKIVLGPSLYFCISETYYTSSKILKGIINLCKICLEHNFKNSIHFLGINMLARVKWTLMMGCYDRFNLGVTVLNDDRIKIIPFVGLHLSILSNF